MFKGKRQVCLVCVVVFIFMNDLCFTSMRVIFSQNELEFQCLEGCLLRLKVKFNIEGVVNSLMDFV